MKYRWYYKIPLIWIAWHFSTDRTGLPCHVFMESAYSRALPWSGTYILAGCRPFCTFQDPVACFRI